MRVCLKRNEHVKPIAFLGTSLCALLSFVFFGVLSVNCQAERPQTQSAAKKTAVPRVKTDTLKPDSLKASAGEKIVVYYFHGNIRCYTCHNLENYAKQAVEAAFADALKNGKLEWKTVNVETAGNEHFSADYRLYTKSVIVSTIKNGKEVSWKNLDKIWLLVRDETKYKEYITAEVRACLGGRCL